MLWYMGYLSSSDIVYESNRNGGVKIPCYLPVQGSVSIAGTLGCVFIDNETHGSGVTKCTTGEAWSAFSWHHSSVFHCQWTHNQVFLLLSHMLIKNAKSIFIYVMKYVSGFIWKLGINFALFIKWIGETWWNNRLLLVPNCYEVVAMVATMVAMVAPLWYIEINKAVSQWLLTFNLCVSVTWPLTCAFHIPCTHTPEIIDMHRGMCDNIKYRT